MNKEWQPANTEPPEKKYRRNSDHTDRNDGESGYRTSSHPPSRGYARDDGAHPRDGHSYPSQQQKDHGYGWRQHSPHSNYHHSSSRMRRNDYGSSAHYRKQPDYDTPHNLPPNRSRLCNPGGTTIPYHRVHAGQSDHHRYGGNTTPRTQQGTPSPREDLPKHANGSNDTSSHNSSATMIMPPNKYGNEPFSYEKNGYSSSASATYSGSSNSGIKKGGDSFGAALSSHVGHGLTNVNHHHQQSYLHVTYDEGPAGQQELSFFRLLMSTFESVSSILHAFDESSQLELKRLLESATSDFQQIEKLAREMHQIRYRLKTADATRHAKFTKSYCKYQEVDRNLRLIEGDLTEVHQQIEALVSKTTTDDEQGHHSAGFWPDSNWKLPGFHDYITGPFVINYGDTEEEEDGAILNAEPSKISA